MSQKRPSIVAKKSAKDGHVSVRVSLRAWTFGDSIKVEGDTHITVEQARALAAELTILADQAEFKVAAKAAADERRKKWREREIAAGRRKVFIHFQPMS